MLILRFFAILLVPTHSFFNNIRPKASVLKNRLIDKRYLSMKGFDDENIIDAEIVENKQSQKKTGGSSNKDTSPSYSNEKSSLASKIFNTAKRFGNAVGSGLSKIIQPSKANQPTKYESRKTQEMKNMEAGIDKIFQGTGIGGSIMGSLIKVASRSMGKMVAETRNDIEDVQEAVRNYLSTNNRCINELGADISYDAPFSMSSSSSSVNGIISKQISLAFNIRGERGSYAQVQVNASFDNKSDIMLNRLNVAFPSGTNINVSNLATGRGRGSGNNKVIDVDAY